MTKGVFAAILFSAAAAGCDALKEGWDEGSAADTAGPHRDVVLVSIESPSHMWDIGNDPDPYAEISISAPSYDGGEKVTVKTDVKEDTKNPTYNTPLLKSVSLTRLEHSILFMNLYDEDDFGDEKMGECTEKLSADLGEHVAHCYGGDDWFSFTYRVDAAL